MHLPYQGEIKRILEPLLGMGLVIDTNVAIDDNGGMVVVECIDDMPIAIK